VDTGDEPNNEQLIMKRLQVKEAMIASKSSRIQDLEGKVATLTELCKTYSENLATKDGIIAQLTSQNVARHELKSGLSFMKEDVNVVDDLLKLEFDENMSKKEFSLNLTELRHELESEKQARLEYESSVRSLRMEVDDLKSLNMEYVEKERLAGEKHARLLGKANYVFCNNKFLVRLFKRLLENNYGNVIRFLFPICTGAHLFKSGWIRIQLKADPELDLGLIQLIFSFIKMVPVLLAYLPVFVC
jgi:hypothetical protein